MHHGSPIERAIVVDDDPVIRGILRSTLAGIGLGVHLAADGHAAIVLAQRWHAGLFLLDWQMPGLNGLKTCQRLRDLAGYRTTPIVVLTGHDGAGTQAAALAAGATMFLTKPFKPAVLLSALAPLLGAESLPDAPPPSGERWGQPDPEYRNQLWGRLDAARAAASRAGSEDDILAE